jgi:antitoxin ParD1/3/4
MSAIKVQEAVMLAYKKYVTIKDPARLELTGLPFHSGQRVEIVMIAEDEGRDERIETLRALFKKTQALPMAEAISEDVIAEEIEEYRAGR